MKMSCIFLGVPVDDTHKVLQPAVKTHPSATEQITTIMSKRNEIGNIHVISGETVGVEWQIPDFLSLSGGGYCSPAFYLSDSRWFLSILPNQLHKWVSLFLGWLDGGSPKTVNVSFGIKKAGGVEEIWTDRQTVPQYLFGTENFIPKSDLAQRKSQLMPSGALTVTCTLTDGVRNPTEVIKKLKKDLENLFKSGEDCDVTIKVQNKEFPAHRNILRARSPVFKSMFSHEMQENLSGVVVIDDCDPETFPDFLNYLYSGSTQHISEKNVWHLFTASDKYQVDELKEECSEFMKSHLSVETFCDFFTLAIMHTEEGLIALATKFFCANTLEIVKTANWQMFLKDNSTVGNELFIKSLSR